MFRFSAQRGVGVKNDEIFFDLQIYSRKSNGVKDS